MFLLQLVYHGDFDGKEALEGIKVIPENQTPGIEYLERYCGRMLEAIDRIGLWVNNMK